MSPAPSNSDKRFDVCVVGELNVDLLLYGKDVSPAFGQAEKLVDDAVLTVGSSSAIFAHQAAKLGLEVAFVGKVGRDLFGEYMVEQLRASRIYTGGVVVDPEIKTGITVHLNRCADRAMLTYAGSIAAMSPKEIAPDLLETSRHLHVGSYYLQSGVRPALADFFDRTRAHGGTTSLDPGWDPRELWDSGLYDLLRRTDYFLPNAEELVRVFGARNLADALERSLKGFGTGRDEAGDAGAIPAPVCAAPTVVVKRGAEGGLVAAAGERFECRPPSVEVTDTTGAGDSFDAGFLFGRLTGRDLAESLEIACFCGALSTTSAGGIEAQPDRRRLEQAMAKSGQTSNQ